jgi:8-oxo-dGTP pyrophosphatase MutT (NUDIX family)
MSDNINLSDNYYRIDERSLPYYNEVLRSRFQYYKDRIMFKMVSRRFSLGFIEFIRGKYNIFDSRSLISLFEQMTADEIILIKGGNYDDILYFFLNRHGEDKETLLTRVYEGQYANEYCEAKVKFNILTDPPGDDGVSWDLHFYTDNIKPRWSQVEWGFPKGRRESRTEENLSCACREFEEETGYFSREYTILNKIEPLEEYFRGTNGIYYKHIYYLSIDNTDNTDNTDNEMERVYDSLEIGDVKWFTYDQAIQHIRPYHLEKKKILTQVYMFILNFLMQYDIDPSDK